MFTIEINKVGANLPVVKVNGYKLASYRTIGESRELLNEMFGLELTFVDGVFPLKSAHFMVEDTQVYVNFGGVFCIVANSTAEELATEVKRRLTIIQDAVQTARGLSYSYTETVSL